MLTTTTLTCGYYKAYPDNVYPDKAYLGLSQSLPTQCLSGGIAKLNLMMLTKTKLTWGYYKAYPHKAYLGLLQSLPTQCLLRQSLITKGYHKAYPDKVLYLPSLIGFDAQLSTIGFQLAVIFMAHILPATKRSLSSLLFRYNTTKSFQGAWQRTCINISQN